MEVLPGESRDGELEDEKPLTRLAQLLPTDRAGTVEL